MMVASTLVLVLMVSLGDELAEARQAFAGGDYATAERLSQEAAHPPQAGAALYLVGLARFRAGHPAEALEALDAAARAEDAPEPSAWSFNRGACLYALERFEEAERAFAQAASEESLARLAWVNAGFAALDAGSPERALQWAERARPGASAEERSQVEDLRSQATRAQRSPADAEDPVYQQGLAAFDAGRFEEARAHFLQAAGRTPTSGRARLMAGASAWHAGNRGSAREDLTAALGLPLEPSEVRIARRVPRLARLRTAGAGPGRGALGGRGRGL